MNYKIWFSDMIIILIAMFVAHDLSSRLWRGIQKYVRCVIPLWNLSLSSSGIHKRTLRRISEPTKGKATRNLGKCLSEEPRNFCFSLNLTVVMKSRKTGWTRHAQRREMRACNKFHSENRKERDHSRDLDVDVSIIHDINIDCKEMDWFKWLRIGSNGGRGSYVHGNESLSSIGGCVFPDWMSDAIFSKRTVHCITRPVYQGSVQ
jgi:hypothetical protein